VLLYACARLGALLVPLNWRLAVPEQMFILSDASIQGAHCRARIFRHHRAGEKPRCGYSHRRARFHAVVRTAARGRPAAKPPIRMSISLTAA